MKLKITSIAIGLLVSLSLSGQKRKNELKRRKVFKAAAMYAATAFIIIDASANVLPRLGLPDWTVTFLIILLIIGFPIILILSWIFDMTLQGGEKTESIELEGETAAASGKKQRLFSASNLVIAILLVIVCILLYPRIFNKDQFDEIRDEKGQKKDVNQASVSPSLAKS